MSEPGGIVAAGHPRSAEVGAGVLRAGGNAVDAAIATVLASWVCEPLLTGPGAGGYMLVAGAGVEPALLDFFVAAPGAGHEGEHVPLQPYEVDFGDTTQVFNCGVASCGVPGSPAGLAAASERWGTVPLADLAAPAAAMAREGVPLNGTQSHVFDLLAEFLVSTPGARAEFAPSGDLLRTGDPFRSDLLAETIERLGADGAAPFTHGDIAGAIAAYADEHGGLITAQDLAGYAPRVREPARADFRGRRVLTNPPPSAGGILLVLAFDRLEARSGAGGPDAATLAAVMGEVQELRTSEFVSGLDEPGFLELFLSSNKLGSTTHVSVLDGEGRACSVTCTNGSGSGVVVPGTGIHLNNIMGEQDLNPLGFFRDPPGRRMPSMMAPTVVLDEAGEVELVLGSAGSNRIRSAILQVVVNVVDHGMSAGSAIDAPRLHVEDGVVYAEPGVDLSAIEASGGRTVPFREPSLFFGGVQAVERSRDGTLSGGGDPRRGGAAVAA